MITLKVNGNEYEGFTEIACRVSMLDFSGVFDFVAVTKQDTPLPFKGNEFCEVSVDGEAVLTGYTEVVEVESDATNHIIRVSGRDVSADVSDSSLGVISDFNTPITLQNALQNVIDTLGGSVLVSDNVGDLEQFEDTTDIISSAIGDNAFAYCQTLARKRQAFLVADGKGGVSIERSSGIIHPANLTRLINGQQNNIKSSKVTYNTASRFNKYIVLSQQNVSALNNKFETNPADLTNQDGAFVDTTTRVGRQNVIVAPQSSSVKDAQEIAKWNADIARTNSTVYTCTVKNHSLSNALLRPNRLMRIEDQVADINSTMLVTAVEYITSVDDGNITVLEMSDKDSLTLLLNQPNFGEVSGDSLVEKFN